MLETLRRDLRTVANDWFGAPRPPFSHRVPLGRHHHLIERTNPLVARPVTITRAVRETKDAVTLHLKDARGDVAFVPGQFLTLVLSLDGQTLRRAYSICTSLESARESGTVAITVKRVEGGRVSNHLVDHAREGDVLQVLGPSGNFTVTPDAEKSRRFLLVGGGSGITPLMAIAGSVLESEPHSHVTLVYGNRAREDVIFHDALAALAEKHGERFVVRHVLEKKSKSGTPHAVGRLDREGCDRELAVHLGEHVSGTECFVCGPEPMMDAARASLLALGVEPSRIHEERFSSPGQRTDVPRPDVPQALVVRTRNGARSLVQDPEQTLLEAGLAAGIDMPFSCTLGGCAACKCKVVEGEVSSDEPNCLTDEERAEGWVLACVSRATKPTVIEVP